MIDPDDGFMSDKLPEISFEAQHRLELSQVSNTVRFGENVRPPVQASGRLEKTHCLRPYLSGKVFSEETS